MSKSDLMSRPLVASAFLLCLLVISGCSNALNDSSARRLVQKHFADMEQFEKTDVTRQHIVVQSCDHLLLGTETTATCIAHAVVTWPSGPYASKGPLKVDVMASFCKRPDGSWALTDVKELGDFVTYH